MVQKRGNFVLSYQWDHHCHDLFEALKENFYRILHEVGELEFRQAEDIHALLSYYQTWHYNKELFEYTIGEIDKKRSVIGSLGYRGYGVNIELLNALEPLKKDYAGHIYWMLETTFKKHIHTVKKTIYYPKELEAETNSHAIITELCKKMDLGPKEHIPHAIPSATLHLDDYFQAMGHETPWFVNTAIFQKLFLHLGCSSNTIMKGSVGYEDTLTPQELKSIGLKNFIAMYKETFASLHNFTEVSLDLLKKIHLTLSEQLVPNAGDFRTHDFPDKNGVTFDFGNFAREIEDLRHVLKETGQSFHDLNTFIYDLARAYYMFIGIHPFWDSNGRVGKCFLNHMLLKKGLPPISFDIKQEIYALPRYGGSMDDMHDYLRKRIIKAVEAYFYERWKLEDFGFLHKQIYNVAFDSGFYFRQIDDQPQKLEVNFMAYVMDRNDERFSLLQDYCRVVFPDERLLRDMTVFCGYSKKERGDWQKAFNIRHHIYIKEVQSDIPWTRAFDVDFVIDLHGEQHTYNYFNCCVASQEAGLYFNNKGLNYSYKMER